MAKKTSNKDQDHSLQERQFVEDLSLLLNAWNIPPMAGRILGMLCLSGSEPKSALRTVNSRAF